LTASILSMVACVDMFIIKYLTFTKGIEKEILEGVKIMLHSYIFCILFSVIVSSLFQRNLCSVTYTDTVYYCPVNDIITSLVNEYWLSVA
jgi:hypothetical protein